MHRLRKTRLKKNMAHVFWDNLHKLLLLTPGYGNCRAVESVKNELHVFHRSHRAWKTRNSIEFSTVPTASTTGYRYEKKTEKRFPKAKSKWSGQDAGESVKTTSPGHAPLAGFEVIIYGRFSGVHRGIVERGNLSIRTSVRRLTRLTNAFSKKWENLYWMMSLYFCWYNFCRVHSSIRCTPATESGLTGHIWSIRELLMAV